MRKYIQEYEHYRPDFKPYFKRTFSPNLIKWAYGKADCKSKGNGAMMRISPVSYLFNDEDTIRKQATLATIPSHYSYEAMDASSTIAIIIYLARCGLSKDEISTFLTKPIGYQPFF